MKRALRIDFYREIKKNRNRFLSILCIVALGVAFFSGVRSAQPDMRASADRYYDETNLSDIRVISTLGLTKEDAAAIASIDGVELVGTYKSGEDLFMRDNVQYVMRLLAQSQGVNEVFVLDGRMPENKGECLVDQSLVDNGVVAVGDTITLSESEDKLTVVGSGNLSYYLTFDRGTGTLGDGTIDAFLMVTEDYFEEDFYTELHIKVAGANELVSYSKEYEDYIEVVKERIEEIAPERTKIRFESLYEEANIKLEDGKKQIKEAKEELQNAYDKLETARKELEDAEQEISSKEKELLEGKKKYEEAVNQLAEKETLLKEKEAQLKEANIAYEEGYLEYVNNKESFDVKEEAFLEQQDLYESNYNAFLIGKERLEQAKGAAAKYLEGLQAAGIQTDDIYEKMMSDIAKSEQELVAVQSQLTDAKVAIEQGKAQLETGRKALETAYTTLQETKDKLSAANKELAEGKAKLEKGKETLEETKLTLEQGETKLAQGKETLEEGKKEYQEGKETYEAEKVKAEEEIAKAEEEIASGEKELANLKEGSWYVLDRNSFMSYVEYGQDSERIAAIGQVFPLIFFLVAALVSLTTMTRMVEEQRVQIGTLKALGYSNFAISMKYISYALLATFGGSVIGVLIGEKVFPYIIMKAYSTLYFGLPYHDTPWQVIQAVSATFMAVACTTLATIFACYKELLSKPATLMRPVSPKAGKRVLLERVPFIWKRLNFTQKSTIRNLFRFKKRFFMTVFGIGACMALLLMGFGLRDSIFHMADYQYNDIFRYDSLVTIDSNAKEKEILALQDKLEAMEEVEKLLSVYTKSITVTEGDTEKLANVFVPYTMEGLTDFLMLRDRTSKEEYVLTGDQVMITEKLATLLGVKKGDEITLKLSDTVRVTVEVTEITENYVNHYVYMTKEMYEKIAKESPLPTTIMLRMKELAEAQEEAFSNTLMEEDSCSGVTFTSGLNDKLGDMLDTFDIVIWVLIISAGLLAFIVLYNLNNINITERNRELATIKLLGFYDGELAAYVYRENVLLTLIGALFGMILGRGLHLFVIKTAEIDIMMFGRNIMPLSYVYSFLLTFLFSMAVNVMMYYRLKKIDMVESLKSVE